MGKTNTDRVITKWEVTEDDVMDELYFKYEDLVGLVGGDEYRVRYGRCIEEIFEYNSREKYTKLINLGKGEREEHEKILMELIDGAEVLREFIVKQAGYYFSGLDYPYSDMYHDFFFDYIGEMAIKGEHCQGCKNKIECEVRGQ